MFHFEALGSEVASLPHPRAKTQPCNFHLQKQWRPRPQPAFSATVEVRCRTEIGLVIHMLAS